MWQIFRIIINSNLHVLHHCTVNDLWNVSKFYFILFHVILFYYILLYRSRNLWSSFITAGDLTHQHILWMDHQWIPLCMYRQNCQQCLNKQHSHHMDCCHIHLRLESTCNIHIITHKFKQVSYIVNQKLYRWTNVI